MQRLFKQMTLALYGGVIYGLVELFWRGYTYPSMMILGGGCFLLLGELNEGLSWDMPLWLQCVIGAVLVTGAELLAGCVLNLWLGLDIWDYSGMPGNLLGQICPQFAAAWLALSLVGIVLDDWLRYWIWDEERPHYKLI